MITVRVICHYILVGLTWQHSDHCGTICHEFSCNTAWLVLRAQSIYSLSPPRLESFRWWPSQFSMHVHQRFLTLFSQMRKWENEKGVGWHIQHSAIFYSSISLLGAINVSLSGVRRYYAMGGGAPNITSKLMYRIVHVTMFTKWGTVSIVLTFSKIV